MRRTVLAASLVVAVTLIGTAAAVAAHDFTDVPTANVFHNDISWLADYGITKGCNPPANDRFCPDDPVTRAQMAAFMHRFGDIQIETTIAIDQLGFSPVGTNHEFTDYDYYAVGTLGRYSDTTLGASIPVPDGAVITGLSATFCDSTMADNYKATLVRRPDPGMGTGQAEVLASVVSKGDGCAITGSTTVITDPEVDTSHYSYAILITSEGGSGGVNIRRATITYESPLVP
jgi:hypothetical protein